MDKTLDIKRLLKAYRNGNLFEVMNRFDETTLPTAQDFISAFKRGDISEDDVKAGPDIFEEIARLHQAHAEEIGEINKRLNG